MVANDNDGSYNATFVNERAKNSTATINNNNIHTITTKTKTKIALEKMHRIEIEKYASDIANLWMIESDPILLYTVAKVQRWIFHVGDGGGEGLRFRSSVT